MAGEATEGGEEVRLVMADFRTFEPCIVSQRSAEKQQRTRRGVQASVCGAAIACVAILLLASHHKGARTSLTPEESITVTAQDIDRLGLSAPQGFETPNIQVTDADIERLGLKAPAGFNVPAINVTKDDIERLGLSVPTAAAGGYGGNIQVTPEDVERYGLVAPSGFEDVHEPVTAEDVDRYGLLAPSGSRQRDAIDVTDDDVNKYGLKLDPVTDDDIKSMGVAPIAVTDDDIDHLGLNLSKVTNQDKSDLGLLGTTYRLTADEAAALGLSGPITLTAEEAVKLGLNVPSVTEGDLDKYGLRDPKGWNATGYKHIP